ncbi:MAG: curli assembly protein CsgF [Sideroxydans sp.]|nr:curli assembly protein CsgF [Sideroxydans sp.]
MNILKNFTYVLFSLLLLLLNVHLVHATELVYVPNNPSFGGNPLNGSALLSAAQAQNNHTDTKNAATSSAFTQKTPLEQFNTTLQQYVLNRIAGSVTGSLFGASGQLIPGTVSTQDFEITIVSLGAGVMQITTVDKQTGQSTSFQISQ